MKTELINVVINVSKVKISKAIHNKMNVYLKKIDVVINVSKVKISKAIHNRVVGRLGGEGVVISKEDVIQKKVAENLKD